MNPVNSISKRLKEARNKLGLKQSDVATDLGIKQKSISEIENGHIQNIPNTYIYYFFEKSISLEWIYGKDKNMFVQDKIINKNEEKNKENSDNKVAKSKSLLNLFDKELHTDNLSMEEGRSNDHFYERIISSKDFSIKTLLKLIEHQENTIEMLKKTYRKNI